MRPNQNQPNNGQQGQSAASAMLNTLQRQGAFLQMISSQFAVFFVSYQTAVREQAKAFADMQMTLDQQLKLAQGASASQSGQQQGQQTPTAAPQLPPQQPQQSAPAVGSSIQQIVAQLPTVGPALSMMVSAVRQTIDAFRKLQGPSGQSPTLPQQTPQAGGTQPTPPSTGGGNIGAGQAAAFAASLSSAASTAVAALQALANSAAATVQAFAPGTVVAFNLAMRDLTATFGVALQPIVQAGTQFARMLGSVLLPVMENLRPVFQELGGVFLRVSQVVMTAFARMLSAMQPAIEAFSKLIVAMEPLFKALVIIGEAMMSALAPLFVMLAGLFDILAIPLKMFGDLLNAITPIFEAFTVITRGLAEVFASLLKTLMSAIGIDITKDAFASLRSTMQQFARAAILAAGALAKMLGFDSAVEAMAKALVPDRKDNMGIAAVQNPVVGGDFNSYQQAVARAALLAGGQGEKPQDEEKAWREGIANDLRDIKSVNWDQLAVKFGVQAGKAVYEAIKSTAGETATSILSAADAAAMDAINSNTGQKVMNYLPGSRMVAGWLGVPGVR